MTPTDLLARLDAIGHALSLQPDALALIGLGSVGRERHRLDSWSDLDFFVVVAPGCAARYLDSPGWLEAVAPVAYAFRNTDDGFKLMFRDGIFCEFAVFEPDRLRAVQFAPGRIVWSRADATDRLWPDFEHPQLPPTSLPEPPTEWLLGEALTNLYVGLLRDHRGEKLSATRFIQGYAVDRTVDLAMRLLTDESTSERDPFAPERRIEHRHPTLAAHLPLFIQGYDRNRASAIAILDFLAAHLPLPPVLPDTIRTLCADG